MPICPKCGEEIDRLLFEQEVIERGTITFEDGRLKFKEDETEANPITFVDANRLRYLWGLLGCKGCNQGGDEVKMKEVRP